MSASTDINPFAGAPLAPVSIERLSATSYRYGAWSISYDPPPIPTRTEDWAFVHKDYDASWEGEEDGYRDNGLAGRAASVFECLQEITEIELERAQ